MKKINKSAVPAGRQGFTLFELLVSISIIAILTALAIVSYSGAQKKARDTKRAEDMLNIQKAAEQYYMLSSGNYPLAALWTQGTAWKVNGQTVLQAFPIDPRGIAYSGPISADASGYCMCAVSEGSTGNNHNYDCTFWNGGPAEWFCITNQQ